MVSFNLLIVATILVLTFQNCAKIQTTNMDDLSSKLSVPLPNNYCKFGGNFIDNDQSVIAYFESTVPYGKTCEQETRVCEKGILSGTFRFDRCAPGAPAACNFNGQTIAHGESVETFQNSTVTYGSTCTKENRICDNGTLSGSYSFLSCGIDAPASCLFNAQNVAHNESVPAFSNSTVPFGFACESEMRKCTNGAMSGTYTHSSCSSGAPASCVFNGQTIGHGQSIQAFQNSSVAFGNSCVQQNRLCDNGSLHGSFQYANCTAGAPASCLFNGQTIAHGQNVSAFLSSTVSYDNTCSQESRNCFNGSLMGSYAFSSCNVGEPASCLFNGKTIAHGQSIRSFMASTVSFEQSCQDENRICSNGSLSGTFSAESCAVGAPATCTFNGQIMAHGQTVQAHISSSVDFGQSCQDETRLCNNGALSGNFTYGSCTVGAPKSCLFNGQTIAHGQSVTAYNLAAAYDPATCQLEDRICTNGNLSGSYTHNACSNYASFTKQMNVTASGAIDILIIIDNSGSMAFEQQGMASRTAKFLDVLKGLNYQIAITTTDARIDNNNKLSDGKLVKLTGSNTDYIINSSMTATSAQTLLSSTLQRSETGDGIEQGIYATTRVIERALAAATSVEGQFIRSNAAFAALIISDEDESASGVKNNPSNLLSLINTNYLSGKAFSFHSIITRPDDVACKSTQGMTYGLRYADFSRLTGGVIGDVCATDYTAQVAAIAEGVRNTAKTITLTCQPMIDANNKIIVLKDGVEYAGAYNINGLNLVFDEIIPNGAYSIKYNCSK